MLRENVFPQSLGMNRIFNRGIILLDDFEGTFNWNISSTGSATAESNATYVYHGEKSLYLKTKTLTPAEDDSVQVARWVVWPFSGFFSMRFKLYPPGVDETKAFQWGIYVHDDTYQRHFSYQYNAVTGEIGYLNSAGAYTVISTQNASWLNQRWKQILCNFDLVNFKYHDLIIDDKYTEDAQLSPQNVGASSNKYIQVYFKLICLAEDAPECAIDDLAITEFDYV